MGQSKSDDGTWHEPEPVVVGCNRSAAVSGSHRGGGPTGPGRRRWRRGLDLIDTHIVDVFRSLSSARDRSRLLFPARTRRALLHRTAPYRVGISTNETYLSTVEHAQTFRHDVQRYRYYRSEDMK